MWHSNENPQISYEDMNTEVASSVCETEMEHIAKPESKETSKLIKSMFR